VTRSSGASRHRSAARIAAALGAALLAAGCGGHGHPSAKPSATATAKTAKAKPKPPSDRDALQALLLERSRAIQSGDADRLAATSTGPQQARDRRQATAAGALPLGSVELQSATTDLGNQNASMRVETEYSFDGVDSRFVVHSTMSLVKTPQGWRVRSDRPSGIEAPWQRGRYSVHHTPHFLLLTPRGLHSSGLLADLEAGRTKMRHALPGVTPPRKLLVIVARGTADQRALSHDVNSPDSVTAMAEARVDFTGPARRVKDLDAQRMLIVWRAFSKQGHAGRRTVVAHEMTHAALAHQTSGREPAWLVEGTAMYASGDPRYGDAGALLAGTAILTDSSKTKPTMHAMSLTALDKPTSMQRLSTVPVLFAYSYSAAAAYAIAAKHGRAGLLRLYRGFGDPRIKGRPGRKLMDRVMRRTIHERLSAVEADVTAFAKTHAQLS
jgi:hypothetical protein